eukprot:5292067-Ditylum_brightwellii.AAC.1
MKQTAKKIQSHRKRKITTKKKQIAKLVVTTNNPANVTVSETSTVNKNCNPGYIDDLDQLPFCEFVIV